MDRSPYRNGFGLKAILVLLAALWLAGCSGSNSASTSGDDTGDPPSEQPPGSDPPEQPPGEEPPEEPPEEEPPSEAPEPTVSLSAADETVPQGESTTLTWSSENADECSASGGWSGGRAAQGSAAVGPLSQGTTFTLTCSGDGGSAMAMLSVSVLGIVTLDWVAPTENVDGSTLEDLAGYRIYYGAFSRNYTDELPVSDDSATQYEVTLPSGSYYFAMTALDEDGNESSFSNEVVKVVN